MSDFYSRLHDSIKRSGFTLDEISQKTGVSTKTIQNWTRKATPTMPRLDQGTLVAQTLGVSTEYLITGEAPGELSEKGLKIAFAAERLTNEGKDVALDLVEGLLKRFPLQAAQKAGSAG